MCEEAVPLFHALSFFGMSVVFVKIKAKKSAISLK